MRVKIPINKGNYDMESTERKALFEKYRGEGWTEEYTKYRTAWVQNAKNQVISNYPLHVDLELSTVCNLKCPMCYTITEQFKNKVTPTLMKMELFKKVIDEIAGKVTAIRLSLRGEPTLHPQFIEMLSYAKQSGIKEVSFLTNMSNMTDDFFEKIMFAGADWITLSIDGTDKIYEQIRSPLKYKETLEKVKIMKEIKKKYNRNRPVIKIQSIWPAIAQNPQNFYSIFKPYVDLIAYNPMSDDQQNDVEIEYEPNFSCPQIYQRLVVGADGKILPCSNDEENDLIIGDANKDSIYDIWHGVELNRIRDIHKGKGNYLDLPICRKCYLPRKMEVIQEVYIEDRKMFVEAYTKRSQEIGK